MYTCTIDLNYVILIIITKPMTEFKLSYHFVSNNNFIS